MARLILTSTLLVLFILEGTVLQILTPSAWGLSWMAVPRFALVGAILVAMLLGRREGLFYGLAIGLLQDVLYGQVIGVYALTMMVACYFAGLAVLLFHRTPAVLFVTVALVLFGHEWFLYSLFRLFSTFPVDVQWILTKQILPSVACNLLFAMLIYLPFSRLCREVALQKNGRHE
ncbi:rod shape-determining protein MreD [Brevibacillus sp. SYP-B805]|uniref:rod shape-determining protein MreD n=1 Tax=Brevibacillus sp. SYP-B805 TaxID=1578199 RepID=UPI0013EB13D1|nr:rod shape-determining protein MreD [Brevibacillus sp. SYP-B805]NGQ94308.1 rod shape-determining protein MreD [Brevibacillus sp. SYP-B805]